MRIDWVSQTILDPSSKGVGYDSIVRRLWYRVELFLQAGRCWLAMNKGLLCAFLPLSAILITVAIARSHPAMPISGVLQAPQCHCTVGLTEQYSNCTGCSVNWTNLVLKHGPCYDPPTCVPVIMSTCTGTATVTFTGTGCSGAKFIAASAACDASGSGFVSCSPGSAEFARLTISCSDCVQF